MIRKPRPSDTGRSGRAVPGEGVHPVSTKRNTAPIGAVLARVAPVSGRAVEIASGTGWHVRAFAAAHAGLDWLPTDIDPSRLSSIAACVGDLPNVEPPTVFDAASGDWPGPPADLVLLVNLLHLISSGAARDVVKTIAGGLAPGGIAVIYGPFRREDGFASEGDANFNAALETQNPAVGYKSVTDLRGWASRAELEIVEVVDMPANNLAWVLRNSARD